MSVDELVQKGVELLTKTPTPDGFMRLAVTLAQEVNAIQALKGSEKKTVVLDILKQAVQKTTLSEDQKAELLGLLKTVVPATLDIAVSVARGGFSLEKPKVGCVAALFRSCLAAVPLDPKLKALASAAVDKAEAVATSVEKGESVVAAVSGAAKEAAVSQQTAVTDSLKEAMLEAGAPAAVADVVVKVAEEPASLVEVAKAAVAEAVATAQTQAVNVDPSIGILIIGAPPPPPEEPSAPQEEVPSQPVEGAKTEDVQDWGASK
jgi:hypothetical protein